MGFKLDVDGLVIDSAGHCIDGQGKARIIDKNTFKSDVAHKRSTIHNRWGEIQHGL